MNSSFILGRNMSGGYTVPYYLAAINGCHPNYASYLAQKQTLAVKEISAILHMIPVEKRSLYNKELVNRIYLEYQSHEVDDTYVLKNLKEKIGGRNIILMAPGGSITDCYDEIVQKQNSENCLLISVTFVPDFMDCDFTFLANAKRYATTFNPMKKGGEFDLYVQYSCKSRTIWLLCQLCFFAERSGHYS